MITSDPSVITRAADLGINYFDTARGYSHGNNERMVGTALASRRKDVIISTKSHAPNKEELQKHLEASLRELNTDYIDIWYLHNRSKPEEVQDDQIEVQLKAKREGKVRFIGVSAHSGQQQLLPWLAKNGIHDVALIAYNFTMESSLDQAIETATKSGMGVVAMKVMAGGPHGLKPSDANAKRLTQEGGLLAALKWVINKPHISTTIPSMTDMDQLDENLTAMANPLSASDKQILTAHLDSIRPIYCRMCGKCDGACQKALPVADILRFLTYADGYGQFALGRERFLELSAAHQSVRCGDCAVCTVNCPHGVRVSDRISRAQELFA